jgi:hypothetical protein
MFFTVLPSYYKFNIKTLFHQIEFHLCDKGENSTARYPSSVAGQLQIQCQTHLVIATLLEGHKFSEIVLGGVNLHCLSKNVSFSLWRSFKQLIKVNFPQLQHSSQVGRFIIEKSNSPPIVQISTKEVCHNIKVFKEYTLLCRFQELSTSKNFIGLSMVFKGFQHNHSRGRPLERWGGLFI